MKRILIGAVVLASTAAGVFRAGAGGPPVDPIRAVAVGCPSSAVSVDAVDALAEGRGLWAVADDRLVSIDGETAVAREALAASAGGGVSLDRGTIRHVAVARGVGTAFVLDGAVADAVVAVTSAGTEVLPQGGEVFQPAWSRRGRLAWSTGAGISVREPGSGRVHEIAAPFARSHVYSPIFLSDRRIAAVVSTPTVGGVFEGERLGDLWTTNVTGGRWHQVTHFRAGGDRWITIRTPIFYRGGIDFVRISARASSTEPPTFELWRYQDGVAFRVERLDGERYLAGRLDGRIVWNRPDALRARYLLQVQGAAGMRTIGCGAVLADPIDVTDPDMRARGSHVPARGEAATEEASSIGTEEIALIVGDFQTEAEAEATAAAIGSAYPNSSVEVVDHRIAPTAIRPGVFGALLHIPDGADPTVALARFRAAMPEYSSNSWVVTP